MGFLQQLGSTIVNTAANSAKQGLVNGILSASKGSYQNTVGGLIEYGWHNAQVESLDMSNSTKYYVKNTVLVSDLDRKSKFWQSATKNAAYEIDTELRNQRVPTNSSHTLLSNIKVPDWGYDMFINERSSFQKGLSGPTGDPGYFYFKIFFNFNTNYGLFGGILNADDPYEGSVNTAIKYLEMCRDNYRQERIVDRMNALTKFTKILSFINSQSPWFFKAINGLDKANIPTLNDFSKEKSIEIECLEDAIDMRLSTMFDLYKYAAYDEYNNKEILPDNLRKFDMSVMIFGTPLKYLHTAIKHNKDNSILPYKQFESKKYDNMPSFKLFTFMNCEFDLESLGGVVPGSMNNETPFQLGKNRIKITYDRVVTHQLNEFNQILFGTTGIYYDKYYAYQTNSRVAKDSSTQDRRYEKLARAINDSLISHYDTSKNKYKELIDASEAVAHTNLMKLTGYSLGNIFSYETKIGSDYWKQKTNWQFNKNIPLLQDIGTNVLLKLLDSSYNASARLHTSGSGIKISDDGWLPGYGQRAIGSQYWKDKVMSLKKGTKIQSSYTQYVEQIDRGQKFDFGQTLYNMFANGSPRT